MTIRLIGQRNTLGIGTHYANFADVLKRRIGLRHEIEELDHGNMDAVMASAQASEPGDINISFVGLNTHELFRGVNIQWTVFETSRVPEKIFANLIRADQIWVPSTWGRETLINHGLAPNKIWVVPEGVDPDRFYPQTKKQIGSPMVFLLVGKYEQRKSIDEVLTAWNLAFDSDPGVKLILKTGWFMDDADRFRRLEARIHELNLSNIVAIWGGYNDEQMTDLYRNADVFVFPSKAEAWGLPLIEAAAQGLPLITTHYSAPCDFLDQIPSSCLFVDYDIGPVGCPDYQGFYPNDENDWGVWALPRTDSLVRCFHQARAKSGALTAESLKNSEIIRKNWSWTRSVDQALVAIGSTAGV